MYEHYGETIKYEIIDDYYGDYKIYRFYIEQNLIKNLLERTYRLYLGYEISIPDLLNYLENLNNENIKISKVLEDIIYNMEPKAILKEDKGFIKLLYLILLDREVDDQGLNYWLSELDEDKTRLELFNDILTSNEFKMKYQLLE